MARAIQQDLDQLLYATADERCALAQGNIPRSVVRRHEYLQARPLERLVQAISGPRQKLGPPRLRATQGRIFTRRTWNYSYGDVFELWSEIRVDIASPGGPCREEVSPQWLHLFGRLGERVLSGVATVYVVRFSTSQRLLAPHVDCVVAIEATDADACLVERRPAHGPPPELYMGGQPADKGILS